MEATARSRGWEGASRTGLVVLVVGLGFVIANLDATIVNVATVTIGRSLGAGVGRVAWGRQRLRAGFRDVSADLGGSGRKFGSRRIFLAGVGVFILASVASAFIGECSMLIAARFFQGLGAALYQPASLVLLMAAFPEERVRARMIGLYAAWERWLPDSARRSEDCWSRWADGEFCSGSIFPSALP